MHKIKKQSAHLRSAIAPTIVAALIFFLTYYGFGTENTMIAPFATLAYLRCRNMCSHYECLIKNFGIHAIMAILAFFAMINPFTCVAVNAAALFWLAYLLIDEYNPNNYFPAGMALIFFQIAPSRTPEALGTRLLALLASYAIIFLFSFLQFRRENTQNRLRALIEEGFSVSRVLLDLAADSDSDSVKEKKSSPAEAEMLHEKLCSINQKCSLEIYSANRAALRKKGKVNWYCRFVIVFQTLNYLTDQGTTAADHAQAEEIYRNFLEQFNRVDPDSDYRRLNFRIHHLDIRNMRLRFALRQVIVLTPCLLLSYLWQTDNIYWLVISVFFMMIPFSEHTRKRVWQRIAGTAAGIGLCFVLFTLFPGLYARMVIMILANFMIYASDGYGMMVTFITCSAMAMQTVGDSVSVVLAQRLIYTLLGAGIALLSNRYIFRIRSCKQLEYLFELLEKIRMRLTDLGEHTTPGDDERRHQIDQLIIKSYLISTRAKELHRSLPEPEKRADFDEGRIRHLKFLAAYLGKFLLMK